MRLKTDLPYTGALLGVSLLMLLVAPAVILMVMYGR